MINNIILWSKKNYDVFIMIGLLLVICVIAALYHTILLHPTGVHMWRQSDTASYALQYYIQGQSFWKPATMTFYGDEAYTVSEFPIIYFIAAQFYAIFGFHDQIIRVIHFTIFLFGIIALYETISFYTDSFIARLSPSICILHSLFYFKFE